MNILSLFFSFVGRLRRRSYWLVIITWWVVRIGVPLAWFHINAIPGASVDIQDVTVSDPVFYEATELYFWLTVITAVSTISASVRRLHDINANGLWAILSLIPVIDFFFTFIIGMIDSFEGTNRYGINPKGVNRYYIAGANEEVRTRELTDLARLYEKGYLTEEEFERQKAKLLKD